MTEQKAAWLLTTLDGSQKLATDRFGESVTAARQNLGRHFAGILELGLSPTVRFEGGEKPAIYVGYSQELGNFHIVIMPDGSLYRHERVAKTSGGNNVFYDHGRELNEIEYMQNERRAYLRMAELVKTSLSAVT